MAQAAAKRKTVAKVLAADKAAKSAALSDDHLIPLLRRKRLTIPEIATKTGNSHRAVTRAIRDMQRRGVLVYQFGSQFGIEKAPAFDDSTRHRYHSRPDGTYLFGFCGDNHLGSKYERLDVLNDLYDKFAAAEVDRVLNAGNWIDGEARFNKHDLTVHGMDNQVAYLVENYPQREGIVTYSVAGDDHEGWYGQSAGIDIGRHAERMMREADRTDWVHLGYMEAFVDLVHAKSRQSTKLLLAHPGGGSAYALSYTTQKGVEAFEGGEKPAVVIYGHYHKLWFGNIRNVWCLQSGCTQDQTTFMRKKRLEAHVGGGICQLTQDKNTGAIIACRVEFFRYFNKGYYNHRWSHGGAVTLPARM